MTREQGPSRLASNAAVAVADQLQRELAVLGISTDVNDGYGLAVVSVWRGLIVWTNGDRFWWRTGWNRRHDRPVYAWLPTADARRTARRVAARYEELCGAAPKPPLPTPGASGEVPCRGGDLG